MFTVAKQLVASQVSMLPFAIAVVCLEHAQKSFGETRVLRDICVPSPTPPGTNPAPSGGSAMLAPAIGRTPDGVAWGLAGRA